MLAELVGAQPDDRQDAEEAEPEADRRGAAGQHDGDRQHADVDGDEGGDEVGAPVAGVVDGQGQDEHGDQVDAGEEVGGVHGRPAGDLFVTCRHLWSACGHLSHGGWRPTSAHDVARSPLRESALVDGPLPLALIAASLAFARWCWSTSPWPGRPTGGCSASPA